MPTVLLIQDTGARRFGVCDQVHVSLGGAEVIPATSPSGETGEVRCRRALGRTTVDLASSMLSGIAVKWKLQTRRWAVWSAGLVANPPYGALTSWLDHYHGAPLVSRREFSPGRLHAR